MAAFITKILGDIGTSTNVFSFDPTYDLRRPEIRGERTNIPILTSPDDYARLPAIIEPTHERWLLWRRAKGHNEEGTGDKQVIFCLVIGDGPPNGRGKQPIEYPPSSQLRHAIDIGSPRGVRTAVIHPDRERRWRANISHSIRGGRNGQDSDKHRSPRRYYAVRPTSEQALRQPFHQLHLRPGTKHEFKLF